MTEVSPHPTGKNMEPLSALALAEVKAFLKVPLEQLGAVATSAIKGRWKKWKNARNVESLATKARAITNVKTLWNIDKETSLYSFYYPSRIQFSEGISKAVDRLSNLGLGANYVIQGTVGQGKSIFLRFLFGQEIRPSTTSGRIPIFVELRRINSAKSLMAVLFDAFERLGFEVDTELFEWYADSGHVVLLLDAFDEIDQDLVSNAIHDLEDVASRHPKLQIVVTSRPDAAIQNSAHFRILRLTPLDASDHLPFLNQTCKDKAQAAALFKALSSSSVDIRGLLTTPLLMTLLVLLYKASAVIPETVAAFYEQLFESLFRRHDRAKPGFIRKRYTKLDDEQVKSLFEALCFQTRLSGLNVLKTDSFQMCLERAKAACGVSVDTWQFRDEIVRTTCLMQEEGVDLFYIHKSVAEFHAADFVRHSSEAVAKRFYEAMKRAQYRAWEQELRFLRDIDTYRYFRYFMVPSFEDLFRRFGFDPSLPESGVEIERVPVDAIPKEFYLHGRKTGNDEKWQWHGWGYSAFIGFAAERFVSAWALALVETTLPPPEKSISKIEGHVQAHIALLRTEPNWKEHVATTFKAVARQMLAECEVARALVRREDSKLELMEQIGVAKKR